MRGTMVTADGSTVSCGVITGRGHPQDPALDDPANQVAVVRAYDDPHGAYVPALIGPGFTVGSGTRWNLVVGVVGLVVGVVGLLVPVPPPPPAPPPPPPVAPPPGDAPPGAVVVVVVVVLEPPPLQAAAPTTSTTNAPAAIMRTATPRVPKAFLMARPPPGLHEPAAHPRNASYRVTRAPSSGTRSPGSSTKT
jgi:hypothetical protein